MLCVSQPEGLSTGQQQGLTDPRDMGRPHVHSGPWTLSFCQCKSRRCDFNRADNFVKFASIIMHDLAASFATFLRILRSVPPSEASSDLHNHFSLAGGLRGPFSRGWFSGNTCSEFSFHPSSFLEVTEMTASRVSLSAYRSLGASLCLQVFRSKICPPANWFLLWRLLGLFSLLLVFSKSPCCKLIM